MERHHESVELFEAFTVAEVAEQVREGRPYYGYCEWCYYND